MSNLWVSVDGSLWECNQFFQLKIDGIDYSIDNLIFHYAPH